MRTFEMSKIFNVFQTIFLMVVTVSVLAIYYLEKKEDNFGNFPCKLPEEEDYPEVENDSTESQSLIKPLKKELRELSDFQQWVLLKMFFHLVHTKCLMYFLINCI